MKEVKMMDPKAIAKAFASNVSETATKRLLVRSGIKAGLEGKL